MQYKELGSGPINLNKLQGVPDPLGKAEQIKDPLLMQSVSTRD